MCPNTRTAPFYCRQCQGTGEIDDPDTIDIAFEGNDSDGPYTCEQMMCDACAGRGIIRLHEDDIRDDDVAVPQNPRERDDDDGATYSDPRDPDGAQ